MICSNLAFSGGAGAWKGRSFSEDLAKSLGSTSPQNMRFCGGKQGAPKSSPPSPIWLRNPGVEVPKVKNGYLRAAASPSFGAHFYNLLSFGYPFHTIQ